MRLITRNPNTQDLGGQRYHCVHDRALDDTTGIREGSRDGVRFNLSGGSWAVARMSGTEPLVRIYAETPDETSLEAVLNDLRSTLGV